MVVHYRRVTMVALLLLTVALPVKSQLRAPSRPRAVEEEEPPRRHSIVTVWAKALESLSHPNPILRWHAARLAAAHPLAYDDEELTRAWMRERDLRVRVALKRTLIARGKGEDLVRVSSTKTRPCATVSTRLAGSETRSVAELRQLLDTEQKPNHRARLSFELALALRRLKNPDSKTAGLLTLRGAALEEHQLLLRAIARDETVIDELEPRLTAEDPSLRRVAVDAFAALERPKHVPILKKRLIKESDPDVSRALLKALRLAKVELAPKDLVRAEQRVRKDIQQRDDSLAKTSVLGYEIELARAILASAQPHELLYQQTQRKLRTWLSPTHPMAGLAIYLMGSQEDVPVYLIGPYADDTRSHVREVAIRVISQTLPATHPMRKWLALEGIDSDAFEKLQPRQPRAGADKRPPSPATPILVVSAEPVFFAWNHGYELTVPTLSSLLFETAAPSNAVICLPRQTWLSFERAVRDL